MNFKLSQLLKQRLLPEAGVTELELEECFLNRKAPYCCHDSSIDDVLAFWFEAKTDRGKKLKIMFNHRTKREHRLQLQDRTVTLEQHGSFFEIVSIEVLIPAES